MRAILFDTETTLRVSTSHFSVLIGDGAVAVPRLDKLLAVAESILGSTGNMLFPK